LERLEERIAELQSEMQEVIDRKEENGKDEREWQDRTNWGFRSGRF
jgi:hypothetical protein